MCHVCFFLTLTHTLIYSAWCSQQESTRPHSSLVQTVNDYLAHSPYRWCLRLQSHLHHRPSSPPPPPLPSPPPPLRQSGLRNLHGDTRTPPLVSTESLLKGIKGLFSFFIPILRFNKCILTLLYLSLRLAATDLLHLNEHFISTAGKNSQPQPISVQAGHKSYQHLSDVASQSFQAFQAESQFWSWSVTTPSWLSGADLSSL